ncbi:MAG: hypothetical protein LRZ98_01530 [Candidatus Pacebacteria bacterium]|nr:hypothetical protein [Candidatus Paceibacterota bacterium]
MDILPIEIFAGRIKDPKIKLNFKFSGFNVDGLYSDKILLREEESIIKIPTQVNLKTNIFFEGEPFINTGNREPIVDKQTTYTAV